MWIRDGRRDNSDLAAGKCGGRPRRSGSAAISRYYNEPIAAEPLLQVKKNRGRGRGF